MNFLDKDLVNPDDVQFRYGLTLPCSASGNNITYEWKFNGISIKSIDPTGAIFKISPSGTLFKKYPDENNNGKYQCYVSNSRGSSFSREIAVKVTGN